MPLKSNQLQFDILTDNPMIQSQPPMSSSNVTEICSQDPFVHQKGNNKNKFVALFLALNFS